MSAAICVLALLGTASVSYVQAEVPNAVSTAIEKAGSKAKRLSLTDKGLTSLEGVETLAGLEELLAGDNKISSIENLAGLTKLKKLHLYNNRIDSLSGIENLTELEELQISNNPLTSLDELKNLSKLKDLSFSSTVTSLEGIKSLPNLKEIRVFFDTKQDANKDKEQIKGLEILANLSNLKKLDLRDPNIIDKDFKDSSEAIFELSKKIPNCIISTRINGKGIQIQDGKEI